MGNHHCSFVTLELDSLVMLSGAKDLCNPLLKTQRP